MTVGASSGGLHACACCFCRGESGCLRRGYRASLRGGCRHASAAEPAGCCFEHGGYCVAQAGLCLCELSLDRLLHMCMLRYPACLRVCKSVVQTVNARLLLLQHQRRLLWRSIRRARLLVHVRLVLLLLVPLLLPLALLLLALV